MIYFILGISLLLNILTSLFVYKSLDRNAELISLIEDLQYKIDLFSRHLENVYQLPMYYGEPTIENLIQHSKILLSSFKQFNDDYIVFNGQEEYEQLQEKTQD